MNTTPAGYAALGLAPAIVQAAAAAGWIVPTPIQLAAIAPILQRRDVLASAPTGSGKTAAFLLPMLQRLLDDAALLQQRPRPLRALILAPTRELAQQIAAVAAALAPQLKIVVAVGGLPINPQMLALRGGAHIVVATPGRLLDLFEQRALQLAAVDLLVVDEADRLLDLGFADEINRLLALLPQRRQTVMLSATLPPAVEALATQLLVDALRVDAPAADVATPAIAQRAIVVDAAQRTPLLRQLIADQQWDSVLVFVATQYASEHVADKLRRGGLRAAALHGRLSQQQRSRTLAEFRDGRLGVLVATDLAARGIDVVALAAVVNHDLPRSATDHLHRIGRTGRADASGVAVSFICADRPGSEAHFRLIEKRQQLRVARERLPGFEPAEPAPGAATGASDPAGGVKGLRKSRKDKLREAAALARR